MPSATIRRSTAFAWTASRSTAPPSPPDCAEFRIQGTQPAGAPALALAGASDAIEVTTGAVLPSGADAVIPLEEYALHGDVADGARRCIGRAPSETSRGAGPTAVATCRCSRPESGSGPGDRGRGSGRIGSFERREASAGRRDNDRRRARRARQADRGSSGPRFEWLRATRLAARARRDRRRLASTWPTTSRLWSAGCVSTSPHATCWS